MGTRATSSVRSIGADGDVVFIVSIENERVVAPIWPSQVCAFGRGKEDRQFACAGVLQADACSVSAS